MKVDYVLLLAAGKGTRMGKVGQALPKVQWPIFEKSILELEAEYVKEYVKNPNIYINLYHEKDRAFEFIKNKESLNGVKVLIEEDKIDIGGAVHNLARKLDYKGNLMVINSDQFLYFSKDIFEMGLRSLEDHDGVLFSYEVNSNDLYGGLKTENGIFKGLIANKDVPRNTAMITYTGMSLWKLDKLKPKDGPSYFFESVANHKMSKIKTLDIQDFEYWDFGTLKRYYDSMFRLLGASTDCAFKNFLLRTNAFDPKKVQSGGYHSMSGINLANEFKEHCHQSIYLTESDINVTPQDKMIVGFNQSDRIDEL